MKLKTLISDLTAACRRYGNLEVHGYVPDCVFPATSPIRRLYFDRRAKGNSNYLLVAFELEFDFDDDDAGWGG